MNRTLVRVPLDHIEQAILLIRDDKIMLDRDLAALYDISTKALKQAVRRNIDRFPDHFMFVLDKSEFEAWRSQFVTSNSDRKGSNVIMIHEKFSHGWSRIFTDLLSRIIEDETLKFGLYSEIKK